MAVVINEFEVIPDSQPSHTPAAAPTAASAASGPTAHEVKLIVLKMAERCMRVRAH
jgi:hypothetical protein